MYNMFENIYKFFSRVFEILSLKIKPKKVEDPEDDDEEKTILINQFM